MYCAFGLWRILYQHLLSIGKIINGSAVSLNNTQKIIIIGMTVVVSSVPGSMNRIHHHRHHVPTFDEESFEEPEGVSKNIIENDNRKDCHDTDEFSLFVFFTE